MHQAVIEIQGGSDENLPCENAIGTILNRLGDRLRRVQKAKPVKKVRETDAILENVEREDQAPEKALAKL